MELRGLMVATSRPVQRAFLNDLPETGLALKGTLLFIRASRLAVLRLIPWGEYACYLPILIVR